MISLQDYFSYLVFYFIYFSFFRAFDIVFTHRNCTLIESVYLISLFQTTFFPYQSHSQLQWQHQISEIKNNQITPWARKVMIRTPLMRSQLWLLQVSCLQWKRDFVFFSTNLLLTADREHEIQLRTMSWQKTAILLAGEQVCLAIMAQSWSLS